jgi:hypothetical protein
MDSRICMSTCCWHQSTKKPAIGQRVSQDTAYLQSIEQRWQGFMPPP